MEMKNATGVAKGILAPKGFEAAYTSAGIKKNNALDMALIYSETPCIAAGTFTENRVFAAPVQWDRGLIQTSPCFNAIVVYSAGVCQMHVQEKRVYRTVRIQQKLLQRTFHVILKMF